MTTDLRTILATKIRTALEVDNSHGDAHALARIAVLVEQAGLSLTPLPEREQPRATSEVQRHPSGVEVVADGWQVSVDGDYAGIIGTDAEGGYRTYLKGRVSETCATLDEAVSRLVAQQRTPSPERSIERGRDDAEEDSRREDEAVS